jgi:predicted AAA+ superfamily ATPase
VERYLDLLEQTFVIFRLPSFSTNPRKEMSYARFWCMSGD